MWVYTHTHTYVCVFLKPTLNGKSPFIIYTFFILYTLFCVCVIEIHTQL